MKTYETTFMINPQADDATIDRNVTAVVDIIKGNDGQIHKENRLGTRRLAYEVAGLTQGYFASIVYDAPTKVLPVLERHFRLEEAYLRNLTIVYEGNLEDLNREDSRDIFERRDRGGKKPGESGSKDSSDRRPAAKEATADTKAEEKKPAESKPESADKPAEPEAEPVKAEEKPEPPAAPVEEPAAPAEEDEL